MDSNLFLIKTVNCRHPNISDILFSVGVYCILSFRVNIIIIYLMVNTYKYCYFIIYKLL